MVGVVGSPRLFCEVLPCMDCRAIINKVCFCVFKDPVKVLESLGWVCRGSEGLKGLTGGKHLGFC